LGVRDGRRGNNLLTLLSYIVLDEIHAMVVQCVMLSIEQM